MKEAAKEFSKWIETGPYEGEEEDEKKKEINKYFNGNKNLLLDKDSIANASKIYILRYCYNNYEKDDEILKNFDLKKIIETEDIWDNEIYNDPKFKEEMNDLIKFNDDNIDNIEQLKKKKKKIMKKKR